jgi:hypothetical protein
VAPVCIPPSDGNVYKCMPHIFRHIYSILHIATFLAKEKVAMTCGVTIVCKCYALIYEGRYECNSSNFFMRKCNYNNSEIYVDGSYFFAVMRLFFYKVFIIFSTLLPVLSKTLCTNVVKFPATASEHIMCSTR